MSSARKKQADNRKALRVAKTVHRVEGAPYNQVPARRQPSYRRIIPLKLATSPSGGIPAKSGSTPGSATCTMLQYNGSTVSSGASIAVKNYGTSIVGAGTKTIVIAWIDGAWFAVNEYC